MKSLIWGLERRKAVFTASYVGSCEMSGLKLVQHCCFIKEKLQRYNKQSKCVHKHPFDKAPIQHWLLSAKK